MTAITFSLASLKTLQAQRNSALDAIADLDGVIAERNEQIAELTAKLADAEAKLSAHPIDPVSTP